MGAFYNTKCTMHNAQCTVKSGWPARCSTQPRRATCEFCFVHCALCIALVHCALCIVHCAFRRSPRDPPRRRRSRWPSSTPRTYSLGAGRRGKARTAASATWSLAGRRLGLGVGVFTMTATWVDGGYVNGTAEQTYAPGCCTVQAPWGYALSLVVGGALVRARDAPPRLHHAARSVRAALRQARRRRCSTCPALTGEVFWTAAILTALGTTFGIILDLDFAWSIVLSAAVVILYTCTGRTLGGRHHRRGAALRPRDRPVARRAVRRACSRRLRPRVAGVSVRASRSDRGAINWWTWGDTRAAARLRRHPVARVLPARARRERREDGEAAVDCWRGCSAALAAVPPALIGILACGADWSARGLARRTRRSCCPTCSSI